VLEELFPALVVIVFGAAAGGITNTVAIWMLFHPYEPPRIWRWRFNFFQGAVPKNQPRLAAAIGRTVGNRLLTPDDLAETFADEEFRGTFDERLSSFLDGMLNEERGSIRELLPPAVMTELDPLLTEIVGVGITRLEEYLHSDRLAESLARRTDEIIAAVADEPIGGILTPTREAAVEDAVQEWLQGAVESEDFRQAVDDYLERAATRLLQPDRNFEEVLPPGLIGSVEKAIQSYLPLAIERLGRLLEDKEARAKFESTIHDLLHRFLRDLKFHQRVVARLVMTEGTVDKVLDTVEAEGAERLSEILSDPAVRDAMTKGVNEAIVDFLRRPVVSVLGTTDDDNVVEARDTLAEWIVGMARDPATRAFVVEKLHSGLEKAGARTWGEVLGRVPPERLVDWLVGAARSDAARRVYQDGAGRLMSGMLDKPIGTPSRWLPEGSPERIEQSLGVPIWEWLQTQVPTVVERIDVARRVEEKVLEFPTSRMEELVRKVTHRELKLIVRLGYVLGAIVGTVLVLVQAFFA
jgi:uncharacterized membrane protein YheB (UPF0754 family)